MRSLNKAWLTLIAVGIIALLFSIGIRVYESLTGGGDEFIAVINELPSDKLITTNLEEHLTSAPDYEE